MVSGLHWSPFATLHSLDYRNEKTVMERRQMYPGPYFAGPGGPGFNALAGFKVVPPRYINRFGMRCAEPVGGKTQQSTVFANNATM